MIIIPIATGIAAIVATVSIFLGNKHKLDKAHYFDKKGFLIDISIRFVNKKNHQQSNMTQKEFLHPEAIATPLTQTQPSLVQQTTMETVPLTQSILSKLETMDRDVKAILSEYSSVTNYVFPSVFHNSNSSNNSYTLQLLLYFACFVVGSICTFLYNVIIIHMKKYYRSYNKRLIDKYEQEAIKQVNISNFENASSILEKAIKVVKRMYGENHIECGAFYHLLGKTEIARGNTIYAGKLFRKCLDIYAGYEDSTTARVFEDLSELLYSKGMLEEAYALLQNALHLYELDIKNKLWLQYENALKHCKNIPDSRSFLQMDNTLTVYENQYRNELKDCTRRKAKHIVQLKLYDATSSTTSGNSPTSIQNVDELEILALQKFLEEQNPMPTVSKSQISYRTSIDVARVNTSLSKILIQNNQLTDALDVLNVAMDIYTNLDLQSSELSLEIKRSVSHVTKRLETENQSINTATNSSSPHLMKSSPRCVKDCDFNAVTCTPLAAMKSMSKNVSSNNAASPDTVMLDI